MAEATRTRIYLVRHGQTDSNVQGIHQSPNTELNAVGLQQADIVATRAAQLSFDAILASSMRRAQQTAQAIARVTPHPIESTDLLREVARPSSVVGRPHKDPDVVKVFEMIKEHEEDPEWRYEDGENFYDARNRALAALEMFKNHPKSDLLAVSHGMFLCYLFGAALLGERLTPSLWNTLSLPNVIMPSNTGISIMEWQPDTGRWRIYTWNDHAHLAE